MNAITWTRSPANDLGPHRELRAAWNRLSAERGDLPFMRAECWVTALTCFGTGREQLLVGRQGGYVSAMLIVVPAGLLLWQTFQPPQMPLGAWVAHARLSLVDLGTLSLGQLPWPALALSILQVDPQLAPRLPDGRRNEQVDYAETGWIEINGSFDQYWAARGKSLRSNLRKQRRRLADGGVRVDYREIFDPDLMAEGVAVHARLESEGWKGAEGTAVGHDNPQGTFYRELLQQQARDRRAAVYQLLFDNRVVASNLCLVGNGCLVVLKTAYDESIDKRYSPAFLLREEQLRRFFSGQRYDRLEFFGRLQEWQAHWTANRRTLYHLTTYRWPWVKRIAATRRLVQRSANVR